MRFLNVIKKLVRDFMSIVFSLGRVEPCIEYVLAISTAHMPNQNPDFGSFRTVEHEYGFVVFVNDPEAATIPEWLDPIVDVAFMEECTLILFDNACGTSRSFKTWDW